MKDLNVALVVFADTNGKLMLNRRSDASAELWEFIGGGIEDGEDPADTIKREIFEEIGYKIDDSLVFVKNFSLQGDNFVANIHYFTASFPGFEHFSDSNEVFVSDLKLFTKEEALALPLLPITRKILES